MKREEMRRNMPEFAGSRHKLIVAVCLLMVSAIMLVTTSYAWYTLSVAPEARDISTSVAGNGSLEIALMAKSGVLSEITSGRAGNYAGGTVAADAANRTWGNLVMLTDPSYGFGTTGIELKPMQLDTTSLEAGIPAFGYDGRNRADLENASLSRKSYNTETSKFDGTDYGVRAIVETVGTEITTYGFVLDFAFRQNTAGSLVLQKDGIQRVYNDEMNNPATSPNTPGAGSFIEVDGGSIPADAITVAFIQNYGVSDASAAKTLLAVGRAGTDGKITLKDPSTGEDIEGNVLLPSMERNTAYQISAVVWLDGSKTTAASFSSDAATVTGVKINLQFASGADLVPFVNSDLHDNPPALVTEAVTTAEP